MTPPGRSVPLGLQRRDPLVPLGHVAPRRVPLGHLAVHLPAAGRQGAAEGRRRVVQGGPDPVELGAVRFVLRALRPAVHDREGGPHPRRDVRIRQQPLVPAPVVAQIGCEKGVDVRFHLRARPPRPCDAEIAADAVDAGMRVGQKLFVAHVAAGHAARARLGVEDVAQPGEVRHERVELVALVQRGGDVERVADWRDHQRRGAERGGVVDPELQQAAGPWVLQDEQPAVAELLLQRLLGAGAEPGRGGGPVPASIERPPVEVGGSRRHEDLFVQIRQRLRLPEAGDVVRLGADQRLREIAPGEGQRGGAAAVHAGHEYHGLQPARGRFRLLAQCASL